MSSSSSNSRRIVHWNVTEHPTADWTIQQFRTVMTPETAHRFVLHDRDGIYAAGVDRAIASIGRRVLKTPVRTPQANAFCERLIGTIRRECLDWLIPLNERHLRWILRDWVTHYNRGRPHASLGPGIPDPSPELNRPVPSGHHLPERCRVVATPILGGLRTTNIASRARPRDGQNAARVSFLRTTGLVAGAVIGAGTRDHGASVGRRWHLAFVR